MAVLSSQWLNHSVRSDAEFKFFNAIVKRQIEKAFMDSSIEPLGEHRDVSCFFVRATIGEPTPLTFTVAHVKVDTTYPGRWHVGQR